MGRFGIDPNQPETNAVQKGRAITGTANGSLEDVRLSGGKRRRYEGAKLRIRDLRTGGVIEVPNTPTIDPGNTARRSTSMEVSMGRKRGPLMPSGKALTRLPGRLGNTRPGATSCW